MMFIHEKDVPLHINRSISFVFDSSLEYMKKTFVTLFLGAMVAISTQARETVEGSKLGDNWSLGVAGGVYTPIKNHAFLGSMRPTFNLTLAKQITPIYGLGVE